MIMTMSMPVTVAKAMQWLWKVNYELRKLNYALECFGVFLLFTGVYWL